VQTQQSVLTLLTHFSICIPRETYSYRQMWSGKLRDITGYYDSHTATATTTLTSCGHYTIKESYERGDTPDTQPILSLEDAMMVSPSRMHSELNEFLTGEFGWANLPLIRDVLQGLRIVPTPAVHRRLRPERTYGS